MKLDETGFLGELRQSVLRRASTDNLVKTMAFVSEVAERLEDDPVFGPFVQVEYMGAGTRNRQLKLHGYTDLDDADGSLGLVVGEWSDSADVQTLDTATIQKMSGWLESFVRDGMDGKLDGRIEESNPAHELYVHLRDRAAQISRIRLHLFSDRVVSQRFKEERCEPIGGVAIERHIWDLQRLRAVYLSSREREAVEISLAELGCDGIPCIEAVRTDRLKSYLCVVEGSLLADLFDRYGSRLLEGNVRSFLGMKGAVNKGIRATIQDAPQLFFAYNNGIAATAEKIEVSRVGGRDLITGLRDFQIVNGGQTTASILNARKKEKLALDGVTVQMKVTEVSAGDAHDLVPRIAQYANTQNKVAVADFFANHPFHRRMEEISRRLSAPPRAGTQAMTRWFYERSRGQFQNERLYMTDAQKRRFDAEHPPHQVINKTELAKYDSTWNVRPHWVSLGAQKNFTKFADKFSPAGEQSESEHWDHVKATFGDQYYMDSVAIAILWKAMEDVISKGRNDWYEGGYRPQITAYALSLLFHKLRGIGREFDLGKVWSLQGIDHTLDTCFVALAKAVQRVLLEPKAGMSNVGEWSKKEQCWSAIKDLAVPTVPDIAEAWSISKGEQRIKDKESQTVGEIDTGVALQAWMIQRAEEGYWAALYKWPQLKDFVTPEQRNLLGKAQTLSGCIRIGLPAQWKLLKALASKCEAEGFRVKATPAAK